MNIHAVASDLAVVAVAPDLIVHREPRFVAVGPVGDREDSSEHDTLARRRYPLAAWQATSYCVRS